MDQPTNTLIQAQKKFFQNYPGRYQPAQIKQVSLAQAKGSPLEDLGLTKIEGFYQFMIRGIKQQTDDPQPHYQSYVHPEQGIIVIVRAYRNEDTKAQGGTPPYFSETLYQQWVQVLVHQGRSELVPFQQVFIHHVREEKLNTFLPQIQTQLDMK